MSPVPAPAPHVTIDGTFNARDVGGHSTSDGVIMRTGVMFRSASLDRVGAAGRRDLMRLGVRTVIDVRSRSEIERNGCLDVADTGIAWHHLDSRFGPPNVDPASIEEFVSGADPMAGIYSNMLETASEMFSAGLRMLAADAEVPMLVHCTSGKDRTGMFAAIVQLVCGVPVEAVLRDYERSGEVVRSVHGDMVERYPEMERVPVEVRERMAGTDREWVVGAFEARGGFDAIPEWLDSIGVTAEHRASIRARFL